MVNFTIESVLIAASEDYPTVDVQIGDAAIASVAPKANATGSSPILSAFNSQSCWNGTPATLDI